MLDQLGENMFVERSCEVAFKKLVVVNCFGNNTSNKFEVTQVVGVDVGEIVDCVCDAVAWTALE